MLLETNRLVVRRVQITDLQQYIELYSDKKNWEFEQFRETNEGEIQIILTETIENHKGLPDNAIAGEFAIALRDDDRFIGMIYATVLDEDSAILELGVALTSKYWRQNYAYEALNAFVTYVLEQGSVHRISAYTDSRNERCIHLLTKVGFLKEGELRQYIKLSDGHYGNVCMFGLIKS